ncbi:MAG TPA: AAA family ATPase [Pirellulales bacterium]|nr:AAA family ATPase [Pirellulales bacterium]
MEPPRWTISEIDVDNFKSLVDFRCAVAKFTCLVGLNGSGKTTLLQWLDFMSNLPRGHVDGWLEKRSWTKADLKSRVALDHQPKKLITFRTAFTDSQGDLAAVWRGTFSVSKLRLVKEHVEIGDEWFSVEGDSYNFSGRGKPHEVSFDYQGSILSQLKQSILPEGVRRFLEFVSSVSSLELLAPQYLRQRTRESKGELGIGGQYLSAFLHELGREKRVLLAKELKEFYATKPNVLTRSLRSGWKQLSVQERFAHAKLITEARHVNDGMLRVLAVLAELQTDHRVAVLDEIENGINPEVVEQLVDRLVNADKQVIVTTHSPMILNYLDDATAEKGVIYLYKTRQGATKAIPFFSISSLRKKLAVMGPGEAFVDTNLTELAAEIADMTTEKA